MADFFAWKQDYISSGLTKYGSGVCWDWIEAGQCPFSESGFGCGHMHPKITLRSDGQGGCKASLSTKVPHWIKLLKRIHFADPNDGYVCDFGKYSGKELSEIPESYVSWCRNQNPCGRMLDLIHAWDASSSTLTSEEDVPTVVQRLGFLRNVSNIEGSGKAERKAQKIKAQIEEEEYEHQCAVEAMYCNMCDALNEDCECADCSECGERKHRDDLKYNDVEPICDDCWPKCEVCGCSLDSDGENDAESGTCSDCREEELQKQKEAQEETSRKKETKKRKAEASTMMTMSTPTKKKKKKREISPSRSR